MGETAAHERAARHRCSVLVVDDDPAVRELLLVTLEADGYEVAAVGNGRDALRHLRSHAETCIIILELALPVMDGVHFRTAQLSDRSLAWIPVVAMSAVVGADRRARDLGARSFVPKPLNLEELRQALRAIRCCRPRRVPADPEEMPAAGLGSSLTTKDRSQDSSAPQD
jgi:CheY-like chemotaxis protein